MKKLTLVFTGLCMSTMALASPKFGVKCTEYKNNGMQPITLFEGELDDTGTATVPSELAPGKAYYLTAAGMGACSHTHWTVEKGSELVTVPNPEFQPGKGPGQNKGVPETIQVPKFTYKLVRTGKDEPAPAPAPVEPGPGQGKGEVTPPVPAVIPCNTDTVETLLRVQGASASKTKKNHADLKVLEKAQLLTKHSLGFFQKSIKAECSVEYLGN